MELILDPEELQLYYKITQPEKVMPKAGRGQYRSQVCDRPPGSGSGQPCGPHSAWTAVQSGLQGFLAWRGAQGGGGREAAREQREHVPRRRWC